MTESKSPAGTAEQGTSNIAQPAHGRPSSKPPPTRTNCAIPADMLKPTHGRAGLQSCNLQAAGELRKVGGGMPML